MLSLFKFLLSSGESSSIDWSSLKSAAKSVRKQEHSYHLIKSCCIFFNVPFFLIQDPNIVIVTTRFYEFCVSIIQSKIFWLFIGVLFVLIFLNFIYYMYKLYTQELLGEYWENRSVSLFQSWFDPWKAAAIIFIWITLYIFNFTDWFDWVIFIALIVYGLGILWVISNVIPSQIRLYGIVSIMYCTVFFIIIYGAGWPSIVIILKGSSRGWFVCLGFSWISFVTNWFGYPLLWPKPPLSQIVVEKEVLAKSNITPRAIDPVIITPAPRHVTGAKVLQHMYPRIIKIVQTDPIWPGALVGIGVYRVIKGFTINFPSGLTFIRNIIQGPTVSKSVGVVKFPSRLFGPDAQPLDRTSAPFQVLDIDSRPVIPKIGQSPVNSIMSIGILPGRITLVRLIIKSFEVGLAGIAIFEVQKLGEALELLNSPKGKD